MSATQTQILAVYDFENIIPNAVAVAPTLAGLNCATQSTIGTLEKPRPRTEIIFKVGSETIPRRMIGPQMLNAAWSGMLSCSVITDSTETDKITQSQYVSQLRYLMPNIGASVNGVLLTKHKIQFVRETGTSLMIKTSEGYLQTSINFNVDFTIQADALTALQNS